MSIQEEINDEHWRNLLAQKKPKEAHWKQIIEQTKEALRKNAGVKKAMIQRCCSALEEKGMPLEMICGRVVKELSEFASRKYLFEVIDKKYKDSQKIREYNHKPKEGAQTTEAVEQAPSIEQKNVEEDPIIWQIPVEKYRIEDVDQY